MLLDLANSRTSENHHIPTPNDDLASTPFKDVHLNLTSNMIGKHLSKEIDHLLSDGISNIACCMPANIKRFIDDMASAHFNVINNKNPIVQELFILYQTCKAMDYYNATQWQLSKQEFRARILFPNLLYILYIKLHKARGFFQRCINIIFNDYKKKNYGLLQRFVHSYYIDEDVIKNDILFRYLGNGLKKYNPLKIEDPDAFYKRSFSQVFYYYFRGEEKAHTSYASLWDVDSTISQTTLNPTLRLSLYRDVMYSLQIQKFCEETFIMKQINYNFNVFKNVVIPNELQNLYFSAKTDVSMLTDNQYKLLKLYHDDDISKRKLSNDTIMKIRENLPVIYQLLKCVHIISPKTKPYNEMRIKPDLVRNAVLEELQYPFRNFFGQDHLISILNQVAVNFTNNLLSGEYINVLTLSSIRITQPSFIKQVREFVKLCLEEALPNGQKCFR